MGIFNTKHEVTAEEKQMQAENLKRLESAFDATKAMGVKKFPDAMQFIYDKERKCFVVVQGPEETFKLKNPWIVDFDQVKDVYIEVEEFWTEEGGKFAVTKPIQRSLQATNFDDVFWRYDIYMNIVTSHPYAGTIRYKMNYNQIITRIAGIRLTFAPRGLELNGKYSGPEIKAQSERIAAFAEKQKEAVGTEKKVDILTHNRPDSLAGKMAKDYFDEKFVTRMENVSKHLDRAYRISKVLGRG